jgi:hypothetical protein
MTTGEQTHVPAQRSAIKVWQTANGARVSTTVYMGDSREELDELVRLAVATYELTRQRLAERRSSPTVHVPPGRENR